MTGRDEGMMVIVADMGHALKQQGDGTEVLNCSVARKRWERFDECW